MDGKLIKLVAYSIVPINITKQDTFKILFSDTGLAVMNRRSLVRKTDEKHYQNVAVDKNKIAYAKYVCTTADIWSAKRRSFLLVLNALLREDFRRESVPLTCRRFPGKHTTR